MNKLGPYKKYVVIAAVIQSIIVVVAGYILFKSRAAKELPENKMQDKPVVERTLNSKS